MVGINRGTEAFGGGGKGVIGECSIFNAVGNFTIIADNTTIDTIGRTGIFIKDCIFNTDYYSFFRGSSTNNTAIENQTINFSGSSCRILLECDADSADRESSGLVKQHITDNRA